MFEFILEKKKSLPALKKKKLKASTSILGFNAQDDLPDWSQKQSHSENCSIRQGWDSCCREVIVRLMAAVTKNKWLNSDLELNFKEFIKEYVRFASMNCFYKSFTSKKQSLIEALRTFPLFKDGPAKGVVHEVEKMEKGLWKKFSWMNSVKVIQDSLFIINSKKNFQTISNQDYQDSQNFLNVIEESEINSSGSSLFDFKDDDQIACILSDDANSVYLDSLFFSNPSSLYPVWEYSINPQLPHYREVYLQTLD